jgi:hypothetical protein
MSLNTNQSTNQPLVGQTGENTSQTPTGTSMQNPMGTLTQNAQINKIQTHDNLAVNQIPEPLDNNNWAVWREQITPVFCLCSVAEYIEGTIPWPADAGQAKNWDFMI